MVGKRKTVDLKGESSTGNGAFLCGIKDDIIDKTQFENQRIVLKN
ncbi:hypothetical protein U0X36_05290 [Bacillus thuringiensis]|nr:hypothetical protein [Bacillus thuringiensis]MDZ3952362.1 hypothetical protein [Bacillus thuringiensis]